MKTSTELHLESITRENYTNWLHDTFITYASATGSKGLVKLGATGRGNYAVMITHKTGSDTHYYNTPNKAIEAYKEFLIK